jgi:two-component system NtrC family response regulator
LLIKHAASHSRSLKGFSPDAERAIQAYAWPGNVRELENKIRGAIIMTEGKQVTAADLGLAEDAPSEDLNLREVRRNAEVAAVRRAIANASGNISKSAKLLGITRPTLYDLMDKYDIPLPK